MTKLKDKEVEILVDPAILDDMAERIKTADKQLNMFSQAKQQHISKLEEIETQVHMLNGFKQGYLEMYFKMSGGKPFNPDNHPDTPPVEKSTPAEAE